jgi:hypothetical protein
MKRIEGQNCISDELRPRAQSMLESIARERPFKENLSARRQT